ncbi:MAG: S8 family serine peptidase [Methanocellales archaeon]|nr:S8 family serine peptidase [Methanocellales archaeon]
MRNPNVVYVDVDGQVKALGEILPWGVDRIDAEVVHVYNEGTGVKVAIIDTGIDYTHPDLDANYKGGIDYVNDDADPMDDNGHGTHCAGIVAAEDNDIGVVGVAPEAYLYAVKVLDSSGSGYLSDVIAGIDWSVSNGMQVISISLGTDSDYTSLHDACDNAYVAGLVLVAAAGNDGNPPGRGDSVDYPGAYSSVIAVAATDDTDARARWSSTGPAVELSAPGVDILSTYPGGYAYGSGTSMACPHVTGTVALAMISYPTYDNVQIRILLQTTADDLGAAGFDTKYGYGLIDADEVAPVFDTEATSMITDLSATAETYPDIDLTWTASTDNVGVDHYNVYRNTSATISKATDLLATTTTTSYTDSTGTAETTYYYAVCAVDAAGNEAELSNIASATVAEAPSNTIHIADIEMSTGSRTAGRNTFTWAVATVKIVDASGNPVEGATVSGHWSSLTTDSDSGVTDANGQVSLNSDRVKNAKGTFTLTVDDVILSGWVYDSAANVETSDSITV